MRGEWPLCDCGRVTEGSVTFLGAILETGRSGRIADACTCSVLVAMELVNMAFLGIVCCGWDVNPAAMCARWRIS